MTIATYRQQRSNHSNVSHKGDKTQALENKTMNIQRGIALS